MPLGLVWCGDMKQLSVVASSSKSRRFQLLSLMPCLVRKPLLPISFLNETNIEARLEGSTLTHSFNVVAIFSHNSARCAVFVHRVGVSTVAFACERERESGEVAYSRSKAFISMRSCVALRMAASHSFFSIALSARTDIHPLSHIDVDRQRGGCK